MKKLIIVILLLLVMTTLVACSTNGETDSVPPVGDTPSTESPHDDVTPPSGDIDAPNDGSQNKPNGETEDTEKPETPPEPEPIVTYDTWVMVTGESVNVREYPSASSRILGRLRRGDGLGLISRDAKWYKVYYKGKQAYISARYMREVSVPKSDNNNIERIVNEGKKLLGYPYIWGSQRYHWGNGMLNKNFRMGEFDCSALMQYMFYKGARINLDVTTRLQVVQGKVVRGDLRRGDLMFFTNSARRHKQGVEKVGHVALYLGDNYILHTATDYALIEKISQDRWNNYLVSKRFF